MKALAEPEVVLDSGQPIYHQIRDQIRAHVLAGWLRPGEQLPTVRAMAVALGINPQTVGRAYGELEAEGLVSDEEGSGTFVATPLMPGETSPWPGGPLRSLCSEFLARATRAGYSAREVTGAMQAIVERRTQP